MKFNIYFTMRGPARTLEVPNNTNPVECVNLASLLARVADNLPTNRSLDLETVGIKVEPAENGGAT